MASIRNTVVVAIMQVGVIVAAVLAAGVCHRVWLSRDWPLPPLVTLFYNYGIAGLLIPLTWAAAAAVLQTRAGVSEDVRVLIYDFKKYCEDQSRPAEESPAWPGYSRN